MMSKTRRILILTLSFGSGHVRAAQVLARQLAREAPGVEVRVIDALADCRWLFRACYVWPYWTMVRYAPALWERYFAARITRMDQSTAPEWAFRWGCPKVFDSIAEFKPECIIAAEVAACEMAALAKREGLTAARIIGVITDYEAEPVWVKPEVDVYAVANREVRKQLCAWGAHPETILTCGIPTGPAFSVRHDERETRARYGINDDAPIVLLMGGGMGPTRMDEVVAQLCESLEPMHLIAIAARDRRVRRRLARLGARPPISLRMLGWTDDVAALMQAAAVLVTKPGGLTVTEAALCALPLVSFDAIPGPEQRNAARITEAGAGVQTNSTRETVSAVLALLRDERARARMSACAATLAQPEASATIARLALNETASMRESARERMTA